MNTRKLKTIQKRLVSLWKKIWLLTNNKIAFTSSLLMGNKSRIIIEKRSKIFAFAEIVIGERALLKIGKTAQIRKDAEIIISDRANLLIGDEVYIGSHVNIRCNKLINIGSKTRIGQFVSLIGGNYSREGNDLFKEFENGEIVIGEGVWIGAHAIILPNVKIGQNAIVGAGSVVTKDIPAFSIAVGNPAKVIRQQK